MASVKGSADVVIIGGGVIGLSIARALARRGVQDVCLLERGGLGCEASSAAGGMLLPQVEADGYNDFFALACRSRDLYPSLARELNNETGIDIELDTTGTLYLALNEHDYEDIEQRYHWQTQAGLAVELLSSAAARDREPCISEATFGALRFPNDIQVENRRLITALANSVNNLAVKTFTETTVEKLIIQGHRIAGVQTSRGSISCQTVVVAAGAWSSFLLQSAPNPVVKPVRGQMVCFESKPQLTKHVIFSPRGYLVPRQDGRLLAGSTSENAGFARRVTAGGMASILQNALEISPIVKDLPVIDSWAGLRPRAADGLPVLGPCGEIDGLFYATGHYRNGILLAPLTAELISEAIVARVLSPLLAPFSPDRFSSQPVVSV